MAGFLTALGVLAVAAGAYTLLTGDWLFAVGAFVVALVAVVIEFLLERRWYLRRKAEPVCDDVDDGAGSA